MPFEKPVCLCHADIIVDSPNTVIEPIERKGAHVDDRTGGTQNNDELEDICFLLDLFLRATKRRTFRVPLSWSNQILLVNAVPRNGDLTNIVKKILRQKLNACHLSQVSTLFSQNVDKYPPVYKVTKH